MKRTIIATVFEEKKYHPYLVETKGKHPVHIIEGGEYITEDTLEEEIRNGYPDSLGWYHLNEKEYQYFKAHSKPIEIEC